MALNVVNSNKDNQTKWYYTNKVKDHFYEPRNIHKGKKPPVDYDGVGMVGSPACGDYMKLWIWVDQKLDKIADCKWRTFGCASAIASTSMLSEMVIENGGMSIDQALKLGPQDIVARLDGLPARKIHCSVLGDRALRSAINDYFRRSKQDDRVVKEPTRVIDRVTGVTDKDIEEAVLEGANTIEKLQEKTKVGVGNPAVLQEVEQLLEFYNEKYYNN